MDKLLKLISKKAILLGDVELSERQQNETWLGNPPASNAAIQSLEKRLQQELPKDYTDFLRCSNGFAAATAVEPTFLKTTEVDFLKDIDAELIAIWSETGNEAIARQLEQSICIAGKGEEQQFLLIPPNAATKNWQYWKFAAWIPGEEMYANLYDYFYSVRIFLRGELDQTIDRTSIAQSYIQHLSNGDLEQIFGLFSENARVISPIYGDQNYKDFYTQLFADTSKSELNPKGIFEDATTGNIALHFDYQWTLRNDTQAHFEVVDILEFDDNNKIKTLTIIYDTVHSRALVKGL